MFSTPKPTKHLIAQTIALPASLLRSDTPKSGTFADGRVAYSFDYNRDRIRLRYAIDGDLHYKEVEVAWTDCPLRRGTVLVDVRALQPKASGVVPADGRNDVRLQGLFSFDLH